MSFHFFFLTIFFSPALRHWACVVMLDCLASSGRQLTLCHMWQSMASIEIKSISRMDFCFPIETCICCMFMLECINYYRGQQPLTVHTYTYDFFFLQFCWKCYPLLPYTSVTQQTRINTRL